MKFFTPQVAWHNRDPVLSVDIQSRPITPGSNTYRAVTSGQDSHVVIWKITLLGQKRDGIETGTDLSKSSGAHETTSRDGKSERDAQNGECIITDEPASEKSNGNASAVKESNVPPKSSLAKSDVRMECLADIAHHQRSVNCVRFSPVPPYPSDNSVTDEVINCPQYLASCDDESLICIWRYVPDESYNHAAGTSNGGSNSTPHTVTFLDEELIQIEKWQLYKTLRGHVQDVLDICWSADAKNLLSCSVDNTAILWDIHKGSKTIMTEAKAPVQGVALDPRGKYLASMSQDRNLRIYHSNGKNVAFRIHKLPVTAAGQESEVKTNLFYDSSLPSYSRRLQFTQGGELLLVPSGVVEPKQEKTSSTIPVINGNGDSASIETSEPPKVVNCVHVFLRDPINQ